MTFSILCSVINFPTLFLERKPLLERILPKDPGIRYVDLIEDRGVDFFSLIKKHCLEGIMAKKKDILYCPGERIKNWLKIKNKEYSAQHNVREEVQETN